MYQIISFTSNKKCIFHFISIIGIKSNKFARRTTFKPMRGTGTAVVW